MLSIDERAMGDGMTAADKTMPGEAAKANEAAELAKDDPQVAAAVGGWKTVLDAKSKSLVTATDRTALTTSTPSSTVH